ncbi:MAG: UDP-N-acetylmuramate dehydrogenase [Candidatus Aegiribacteria sp.]|nr:UDP-N-acetylmuramate dehydrogenase [Candidatus Aegiribacteria sp.]
MNSVEFTYDLLREHFPADVEILQLRELTTWQTGGPAVSVTVTSSGMLADLLGLTFREGIPWFILGQGSNVLASDSGCREVIIRLSGAMSETAWYRSENGWDLIIGGGVRLPSLSGAACSRGASGLEFAIGIPGTVGGAVFMNAGAYGNSISDFLKSVSVLDYTGSANTIAGEECCFGYRFSRFQKERAVITGIKLSLGIDDPAVLRSEGKRILELRRKKFPLQYPNAGSVFRKPDEGIPPGKLIEDAGLKGRIVGGAMVSCKHANFIINTGEATSDDIAELIDNVREYVLACSGILLKEEIRYLGRRN